MIMSQVTTIMGTFGENIETVCISSYQHFF